MRDTAEYKVTLRSGMETAMPEPTWGFFLEEPAIQVQQAPVTMAAVRVASGRSGFSEGGVLITQAAVMSLPEWEHRQRVEAALEETNRLYGDMLRRLAD
jgi:hypothetical protein